MKDRTLCLLTKGSPPGQVLLGYKKIGFGAGKYTGIGGKVEPGETIVHAAIREMEEETSIKVSEQDLQHVGRLTFLFPYNPAWSQVVHVFRVMAWEGNPAESNEVIPGWFEVNQLPFGQMWQDAPYWMPIILKGEFLQMRFVFENDNETIKVFWKE